MSQNHIVVQCVYGERHIDQIKDVIAPKLRHSSKRKIKLFTINYDPSISSCLNSGIYNGIEIINIDNTSQANTGFAENHNKIFRIAEPEKYFVILNPDCIAQPESIDLLIKRWESIVEGRRPGIVEGRQWPFEHPKEYDPLTLSTPWASGAFSLIDAKFYRSIGGMDELYFMYAEDVDLSWQAWLNGYAVVYEPLAVGRHFSGGAFYRRDLVDLENYFSLRNFLILSKKFFGQNGEERAFDLISNLPDKDMACAAISDYKENIQNNILCTYWNEYNPNVKILDVNIYHRLRN